MGWSSIRNRAIGLATASLMLVTSLVAIGAGPAPAQTSPSVSVTPGAIVDGEAITVSSSGFDVPDIQVLFNVCPRSYVESPGDWETTTATCGIGFLSIFSPWPISDRRSAENGDYVCSQLPGGCVVVASTGSGDQFAWRPITVEPKPAMTLDPPASFMDGQLVTVSVTDLVPGAAYVLVRCGPRPTTTRSCEPRANGMPVTASATGTATATVPIAQRLTIGGYFPYVYCRTDCRIGVLPAGSNTLRTSIKYAMSGVGMSIAPVSGLAAEQDVGLGVRGLQPSYAGPTVLFPTGFWAVAQCRQYTEHTLWDVFTSCAIAPGGATVEMPPGRGPADTVSATVQLRRNITTILGEPVDCGATTWACEVAWVRWEQDGTVSYFANGISFAP